MPDTNLKNIELSDLVQRNWRPFNALRNEPIDASEYGVVLYLLNLVRFGYLNNIDQSNRSLKELIEDSVLKGEGDYKDVNRQLYYHFDHIIKSISLNGLSEILNGIANIDQGLLLNNYAIVFESILDGINSFQRRDIGAHTIPKEVTEVILHIASKNSYQTVYNPFAGFGSIAFGLSNEAKVLSQEINPKIWAISQLRLLANAKSNNYSITLDNSIDHWNPSSTKYDLIVSAPPFSLRLNADEIQGRFGHIRNCEQLLLDKGLDCLKSNGRMIVLLPQNILFSRMDLELRRYIVEQDWLEYVITIPNRVLDNTMIASVVLVLNKNKVNKGEVILIDCKDLLVNQDRDDKLNSELLIKIIDDGISEKYLRKVEVKSIVEQGFDLNVPRYFLKAIEGVELGFNELTTRIIGDRITNSETGKFIRIRNLADDMINSKLDLNSVEDVIIPDHTRKISESCLLVALRWKTLKPTIFEFSSTPIFVSNDILAIKIDETKLDWVYLTHELNANYILEQLNYLSAGGVIPSLKRDDFFKLKIELPALAEQKAKSRGAIEAYFKSRENELELAKKMQGLKEDTTREFQSIKHTFRQYLSALKSNVSGTRKFISNHSGEAITLDMIYSKNLKQDFGDHLQSIDDLIDDLGRLLINEIPTSDASSINNVYELTKSALGKFKNEDHFVFDEIEFDSVTLVDENNNQFQPLINISTEDYNILFSNIITNAIKHGFSNSVRKNVIKTYIGYDNGMCLIEFSNNGKPIAEGFSLKHLTTRGEKTTDSNGIGSGGADIKYIVDKYNGELDLINNPLEEFPVKYILKFPLIKTIFQ